MNKPSDPAVRSRDPTLQALSQDVAGARDPQIMRIVAMVDAMTSRGLADALIAPLRQRLRTLRPPRPLRFNRLMFHPLDPLIVPAAHWRPGQNAIPRTALPPIAEHVRLAMAGEATAIQAEITGRTNADTALIGRLGRSVWPAAVRILGEARLPETWETTQLGKAVYRPLADTVAALLDQMAVLDAICAETVNGLFPPRPDAIGAMLSTVMAANPPALPMLITLLLVRLPEAAALVAQMYTGSEATAMQAAMDQAVDRLLRQLDEEEGTEAQIAAGTLTGAGAAAKQIMTLLAQLNTGNITPRRRQQLRIIRQRLDAGCTARFTSGLQEDVLTPLQHLGIPVGPEVISEIEAAARGLRVLQAEAQAAGSRATYDLLLRNATELIKGSAMRDRLLFPEQLRLVEILAGPDAALAMLDTPQ